MRLPHRRRHRVYYLRPNVVAYASSLERCPPPKLTTLSSEARSRTEPSQDQGIVHMALKETERQQIKSGSLKADR